MAGGKYRACKDDNSGRKREEIHLYAQRVQTRKMSCRGAATATEGRLFLVKMNKDEFLRRRRVSIRRVYVVGIIWLILFFGGLFGNLRLVKWLTNHKSQHWMDTIYGPLFFAVLFGNVILVLWWLRRLKRDTGLFCPACGKPFDGMRGKVLVSTGKCGSCGATVFPN